MTYTTKKKNAKNFKKKGDGFKMDLPNKVSKKLQRTWRLIELDRIKNTPEPTEEEIKKHQQNIKDILKLRE